MEDFLLFQNLVDFVKQNNYQEFKRNIENLPKDVVELTNQINDKEKERLIKWCKDGDIYLIHRLFTTVNHLNQIQFLKNNLTYFKQNHLYDNEKRTWLHVAVLSNLNNEILDFLINDLIIDVDKKDINGNTALHFACQKVRYNEGELNILITNSKQLISPSFDDVTPLELSCTDFKKLKELQKNSLIKLQELLEIIDDNKSGLPQYEDYYFNDNLPVENIWLNLLHKNEKYRLMNLIKKDINFKNKYYLTSESFINVFTVCHENGQGVVTYIRKTFFTNNEKLKNPAEIFQRLSGLQLKESSNLNEHVFYKSVLFLVLITGRFELVPPLLCYCQFDIIPFGLIVCLLCQKLTMIQTFPDQVIENIKKLKTFCENYTMEVLNRTMIRDSTTNKKSISNFLFKSKYFNKTILDIAYIGKCKRFLSLPSCQGAFNKIWWRKSKHSPFINFFTHSIVFLLFLLLLGWVLINRFYLKPSIEEIVCYFYGFGYLIEEFCQIYIFKRNGLMIFYLKNSTNIIDLSSLFFMAIGFVLRVSFQGYPKFNEQNQNENFFVIRFFLCISFILFCVRLIYLSSVLKKLGPKLKMISKMIVKDLVPLIFIFIVFIYAFGITFQSLLYPNMLDNLQIENRSVYFNTFVTIFRRATFTIFDIQFTLNELNDSDGKQNIDYQGKIALTFFLIIYIVVVNVMLMNLLIALFSYTVTEIIQKSNESWKANRYKDIKEYLERSNLPSPLNIFEISFKILSNLIKKKTAKKIKSKNLDLKTFNLLNADKIFQNKSQFSSFEILQAFALRDCRYQLVQTDEDKEYERQREIKLIHKKIDEKFK